MTLTNDSHFSSQNSTPEWRWGIFYGVNILFPTKLPTSLPFSKGWQPVEFDNFVPFSPHLRNKKMNILGSETTLLTLLQKTRQDMFVQPRFHGKSAWFFSIIVHACLVWHFSAKKTLKARVFFLRIYRKASSQKFLLLLFFHQKKPSNSVEVIFLSAGGKKFLTLKLKVQLLDL